MKTLIGVNTLESVNSFVYSSHIKALITMKKDFPDDEFLFFTPYRMSIDNMRNTAARIALDAKCDYIWFIDDDVILQPDVYKKLREADKDIAMALTFIRGFPFHPMIFKVLGVETTEDGKRAEKLTHFDDYKNFEKDHLVECGAVGFSCALIKMDLVRAVDPPYFVTGKHHTEDVYFCLKARYTLDPTPTIFCRTDCCTGHINMADMVIDYNVEKMREFYAPDQALGKSRFDRIDETVKRLSE